MPLKLKEDDGYTLVEIETKAGVVPVELDLFEASNKYAGLCDQFDPNEMPGELTVAWVDWLTREKGCPPISHGNAMLLAAHVRDQVAEFKKKAGGAWGNPASDASSASPSTGGQSPN